MKVYHSKTLTNPFAEVNPIFPIDYNKVADIETKDLNEAYELSNSINSPWLFNNKVKSDLLVCRSTSVGDVIEDNDGNFFMVDMIGFKELKPEL